MCRRDRLTVSARGAVAADDLPEVLRSTAQLVQEGLGAVSVEITTAGTSTPVAAGWPPTRSSTGASGVHVTPLARSGSPLGRLRVAMPRRQSASPPGTGPSSGDVAEHVATILQTAVLRDALRATVAEAELRAGDLRASRQRLVLASQQGRRRVERDIHDGAQQHLVALAVHLGLLPIPRRGPAAGRARGCRHGPHRRPVRARRRRGAVPRPVPRTSRGARARSGARAGGPRWPAAGHRAAGSTCRGIDPDVEAAVYFCCLEAMQNAAKHGRASRVDIRLTVHERCADLRGVGRRLTASPARSSGTGTGLQNMRDRLEALAGSLAVMSAPGAGTTVSGEVPFRGRRPGSGCRRLAPRRRRPRAAECGRPARLGRRRGHRGPRGAQAFLLAAAGVPLLSAAAVGEGFPGIPLATVVGALVGAVILSRHPRHRVGWLFCLGQLGVAIGLAARAAGNLALADGRFPHGGAHGRVGRRPPRRRVRADAARRPAPAGAERAAAVAAVAAGAAARRRLLRRPRRDAAHALPAVEDQRRRSDARHAQRSTGWSASRTPASSPGSWPAPRRSSSGCGGPGARSASRCAGSRWPRSVSPWSRWLALAVNLTGRPTPLVLVLALQVAYLAVPVATGFAVLRYRLYDVDRVIGGAVVLTVVVVVASAGYLVAVASVGRIAEGGGRPSWLALVAFVAVVLLLQPVRRVAVRAADRLVYGPRAARYAVLVAHSDQLADAAAGVILPHRGRGDDRRG